MRPEPGTIAQILILALGIYMLLSFLRTTRGSGLVRGVGVALILLVAVLYGVARRNEWLELQVIIKNIAGFLAVILAIIFQPELRRGMVSLGDHSLLGRFLRKQREEIVTEVATAVVGMAKKKQGALIAFERQTPLDAYIEQGVRVDAEVTRLVLDSIFQHGGALHDGAVIIRGNRIEAAACIFPLTENEELSKSTGTRHRAALGLTEETDAVTVMVSEETGFISICKAGKLERRIARAELEQILGDRIGVGEGGGETESEGSGPRVAAALWLRALFTEHLGQKAGALLMAIAAFMAAYTQVHDEELFDLTLDHAFATESRAEPTPEKLIILLPNKTLHVSAPPTGTSYRVRAKGARADLDSLANRLGGVMIVSENLRADSLTLSVDDVEWGGSSFLESLEFEWASEAPRLSIQRFERLEVELDQKHIPIDSTELDAFYEQGEDGVEFTAEQVEVIGPKEAISQLASGELPFALQPIVLNSGDRDFAQVEIALTDSLTEMRLAIGEIVYATLPIVPTEFRLGTVKAEVSLQSFDPRRPDLVARWEPPSRTVDLTIFVRGVLPRADAGTATDEANRLALQKFVEDNVRCFIDVGKIEGTDSREGTVETGGIESWRTFLGDVFPIDGLDADAEVWVELAEGDRTILLKNVEPPESDTSAEDAGGGSGEDTQ